MTKIPLLAILAVSSIALTGCAATTSSDMSSVAGYDPGAPVGGGKVTDLGSAAGVSSTQDASVITTAYAFLTDDNPSAVADEVDQRVKAAQGKIDGRSVSSDADGRITSVSLTVRVPSAAVDSFLAGLSEVATVHDLSQNSTDVTLVVTDYQARISALESSIARFVALEKSAKSAQDLIDIETALSDRQAQLEQLQSEMRYYSDQIALSTIQVEIGLPASATDPIPDNFWGGIVSGWKGLLGFLSGIIVAIGVAIPWLPLVAGVGWLGWWGVRRFRGSSAVAKTSTPKATKSKAKR